MKRIIIFMVMLSCLCASCTAKWVDLDSCVYAGSFSKNSPVAGKEEFVNKDTFYIPYTYYEETKDYYINPATIHKEGNIVIADIIEIWDEESLAEAIEMRNEKAIEKNENAVLYDIKPITIYTLKYDMATRRNAIIKKVQMDADFNNETVKIDNTGEDIPLTSIHMETPSKAAVFYKLKEMTKGLK